jgi:hypothetical protein
MTITEDPQRRGDPDGSEIENNSEVLTSLAFYQAAAATLLKGIEGEDSLLYTHPVAVFKDDKTTIPGEYTITDYHAQDLTTFNPQNDGEEGVFEEERRLLRESQSILAIDVKGQDSKKNTHSYIVVWPSTVRESSWVQHMLFTGPLGYTVPNDHPKDQPLVLTQPIHEEIVDGQPKKRYLPWVPVKPQNDEQLKKIYATFTKPQ